jgi:hypothetical protein
MAMAVYTSTYNNAGFGARLVWPWLLVTMILFGVAQVRVVSLLGPGVQGSTADALAALLFVAGFVVFVISLAAIAVTWHARILCGETEIAMPLRGWDRIWRYLWRGAVILLLAQLVANILPVILLSAILPNLNVVAAAVLGIAIVIFSLMIGLRLALCLAPTALATIASA